MTSGIPGGPEPIFRPAMNAEPEFMRQKRRPDSSRESSTQVWSWASGPFLRVNRLLRVGKGNLLADEELAPVLCADGTEHFQLVVD